MSSEHPKAVLLSKRHYCPQPTPRTFYDNVAKARPYIFSGFVVYPMFWLYRGMAWDKNRVNVRLLDYIQKTHFQARALSVGLILTGISVAAYATYQDNAKAAQPTTARNMKKDDC